MKQRQNFIKTVLVATFCSLVAMTTTSHAKQYYKWVDSKGSTHYTTTPPPKNARSKSKIDTYGYRGATTQATQPAQPNPTHNNQPNTQPANTAPNVNSAVEQPKVAEVNPNHNQQNQPPVEKPIEK